MTSGPSTPAAPKWTALAWSIAALFAFPLFWLLTRSLASPAGYAHVLARTDYLRWLASSLMLSCGTVLASVLLSSLCGFVLGTYRFPGRAAVRLALVALAALPPQLLLPGGYELVARLALFDTYWAVALPGVVSVLSVLMFQAAYANVPHEMLEAARVDGASEWRIWWRIAFPVVRPTSAACLMMSFAGNFNAVVWPTIVLQRRSLQTLPTGLTMLAGTVTTHEQQAALLAGTVLALLPILALFLLLQREFLPDLARGSTKG